ncbi:MAG: glycerol-3-phosphate 1-O-acyltransferase PlsY [Verrucomicrobia bacterium]|nr:glycerol-3-phosphate 1-O-acyltransferase PlsY [Verrucomicrobiota bacterium]
MSFALAAVFSLLAGYIAGSIPFAVLIARSKGVDIFKHGSGNPGATNVLRVLGKPAGYTCFLLDAGKGMAAVFIANGISLQFLATDHALLPILGLLGAILGHSFSAFLKFKGGKGVATTVGGIFAMLPGVMTVGVLLWVLVFYLSGYVSLASIVLGVSLPVSALISSQTGWTEVIFCLLIAILIIIRHRANIQRLLAGTENRYRRKS